MKPTTAVSCIVVVLLILAACAPGPKKAKYTVDQYLADRPLMNKRVEECANNPGELDDDPDCINAIAAARQAAHKSLRDLYRDSGSERPTNKPEQVGDQ
ncbi:EexN family lipoprotein [Steroidobacter flavus]|uniref:EexN family lipoprotein n=1 Tax=Steroidobacter flavus TaxID=1842136 RepID=A0ABV8SWV9_9GAMM